MPSKPQETSPLLPSPNGDVVAHVPAGEPSWLQSWRYFIFGSRFNILLIFVPLCLIAEHLELDAGKRFWFSFFGIMPLAMMLGVATDQLSLKLGDILAGLLNASFGNAVEIIVGVVALMRGELAIVQTSMLGSVLSNILLVLGCSFLVAGVKRPVSKFEAVSAQTSSSMMTLACITLVIPAAYYHLHLSKGSGHQAVTWLSTSLAAPLMDPATAQAINFISLGTAVLLLFVYVAYIIFLLFPPGESASSPPEESESDEEPEEVGMSTTAAAQGLLVTTIVTAICAEVLVGSIEEFAVTYNVPRNFIGLILLPIVANAAEHLTAVWMAAEDRMELTLTICVGSSIQIMTFVVPLLVVIGWITDHTLTLFFPSFETIVLFTSVFLVSQILQDGMSNIMEGLMLLTLYAMISIASWVQ
ncbi:calcium/proton exchanger [Pluteus cervinus]|uniref:Calcium/proton exchanger n=1 Tax=Pluteus cervinus TaxID=181527 RepID=A0ACD3A9R3_9AGAR|nr:calcium/proton exchanger [Pluteus cervinus]